MYNYFEVARVLVIAPKRVAEDTWSREHEKWDHLKDLRVSVVTGTPAQRKKAIAADADVFVNPTREDTFPTVNIEALACGTPVATFRTGGSPEIPDHTCGIAVKRDDYQSLKSEIIRICEQRPFQREDCVRRAACFQANKAYAAYVTLYEKIVDDRQSYQSLSVKDSI